MLSNPQNVGGKSEKDKQKEKGKKDEEEENAGEKIKKSLSLGP